MNIGPLLEHIGDGHIESDVVLEALLLKAQDIPVILAQKLLLVIAVRNYLLLD